MKRGGGKAKGSQFEREVCVALSKWISNDLQMDIFWRSAMSGGRATVAKSRSGPILKNQVGDISCIDPLGFNFINAFAVECKFYSDLEYIGLLNARGKLLQFWSEIRQQAASHQKHPFLCARQNRMHSMIGLGKGGARLLGLGHKEFVLISPYCDLHLIPMERFFRVCKPYL
jgi:hypothetical protein